MKKKIAIIGTVGLPAKYGGFESLAEYLTKHLGSHFDISVYCSGSFYKSKLKTHNHARLVYIPLNANGAQSILYDIFSIFHALFYADALLILGVSGCVVLPFIKLISSKKIIVNIDGLEWKRAKWGKAAQWFLRYSEKLAVKYADSIIADNKVIQNYVQDSYNVQSVLIAYGADHTTKEALSADVLANFPFLHKEYAFKVCRIEPENNIHVILEAFSECSSSAIVMVGNWGNSLYGAQLKQRYAVFKNIHLLDPIYDQKILNQIRSNCAIYIHGHSAGGTNPSLVEAMYLGLPVISYGVGYNIETTANKAIYFNDKDTLIEILNSLDWVVLKDVARDLKMVADEKYTWAFISERYASLF